jgi:excisionase family DNA binding protein
MRPSDYEPIPGGGRRVRRKVGFEMATKGVPGKRGRPPSHYETVLEICLYLGKSRATLYRMMDRGLPFRYVGSNRMFLRSKVDAWLEDRTQRIIRNDALLSAWQEER